MAVNLTKHKAALEKAWSEIRDQHGSINWVIFGYEGTTFDLKVIGQGDGGLEEMSDDLNGGKILYAGLRVIDPNTNLPKTVFVNWQGEGVPANVKGACANHLKDITNLFRGAHVQINARSEDDVDEKVIMDKVQKSSGAQYSIHKEAPKEHVPQGNVGSVYQRARPDQEINVKQRDKFWTEREKEEKSRKEEETKRLEDERRLESQKRAERERQEAAAREHQIRERTKSIDESRAQADVEERHRHDTEKQRYHDVLKQAERDDAEFRKRADSERRQRMQEAQHLIKKRQESIDQQSPQAVFEEPSAAKAPAPTIAPKKKAVVPPPAKRVVAPAPAKNTVEPPAVKKAVEVPAVKKTVELPAAKKAVELPAVKKAVEPSPPEKDVEPQAASTSGRPTKKAAVSPPAKKESKPKEAAVATVVKANPTKAPEADSEEPLYERAIDSKPAATVPAMVTATGPADGHEHPQYEAVSAVASPNTVAASPLVATQYDQVVELPYSASRGQTARALYDYQATDSTEITFDPGDVITNIEQIDAGWWRGTSPAGHQGLFPSNYVELITDPVPSHGHSKAPEKDHASSSGSAKEADVVVNSKTSKAPTAAVQGLTARALYDYQAADGTEITFDPGDVITNIEQIDAGWWRGTSPAGLQGLFPANFVEIISSPHSESVSEPAIAETAAPLKEVSHRSDMLSARAIYEYDAADQTEISLDRGDVITEITKLDAEWWQGRAPNGRTGVFPASYVELLPSDGSTKEVKASSKTTSLSARALYDYQAADDTEITFDPGDMIVNIVKVDEGWWRGTGPTGQSGLFPANYVELV